MVLAMALFLFTPARQDDRARILNEVDSWYKVMQDGKNRGYVHEKLERLKETWTYTYRAEFEIAVKDGWHVEYRDVEATLDEELAVTALSARSEWDKVVDSFTIEANEEKRTVLIPVRGKNDRREALAEEVHPLPTLLFYSLRQSGRLAKTGTASARVLVPRAEGRVESEVRFDVAPFVRKEIAGKTGPVTPVKFLRAPAAARAETEWTEALVDKFGRLVEITLRGGARIVMVPDDLEAFRDSTVIHRSHGREIFEKKGPMTEATKASTPFPEEPKAPKVNADNLLSSLEAARKALEDLRAHKQADRANETAEAYFALVRQWKAIREKAAALDRTDVVAKVDELRDAAESLWDGAAQALAAARASFLAAAEALGRTDLAGLQRELRALKIARGRIELERRPELEKVLVWISQTEPMVARCGARLELAKKPIIVTGVVLASAEEPLVVEVAPGVVQNIRFVRDLSTAAINGKSLRAGEEIEEGLRLEKISSRSVTVSHRGELREVPLGGK